MVLQYQALFAALEMANLAVHKPRKQNSVWTYPILILFTFKYYLPFKLKFGLTKFQTVHKT